jgi:cbb3-type cytochrome oxidase subunit 3
MKLSDVMSAMNLAIYAEVGLVIFMVVFVSISVHVFRRRNAPAWEAMRHLPLADTTAPLSLSSDAGDDR